MFGKKKNKKNNESNLQQQKPTGAKIICPYCFKAFDHDQVHFRAPYTVERSAVGGMNIMGDDTVSNDKQDSLFVRREKDDKLEHFWSRFVGAGDSARELYPENWDYPVITPENKDRMTVNGYEFDGDGTFINHVRVRKNAAFEPGNIRLCPHCHNPLPSDDYGKYPIYFISILGITSSGKTVYLSRLLEQQPLCLAGLVPGTTKSITKMETVAKGKALPAGSSIAFKHPISITVNGGEGIGYYTLVLYDIAGENCMVVYDTKKGMAKYGEFIKHSSGIILLTDPSQMGAVAGVLKGGFKNAEIEKVLNAYQEYIAISDKMDVPIAVSVAKSDELREFSKRTGNTGLSKIFKDIPLVMDQATGIGAGFDVNEAMAVSDEMRRFLNGYAQVANGMPLPGFVETKFKNVGYFAVSALDCGVDMYIIINPETGEKRKLNEDDANKVRRMKEGQEIDDNGNVAYECEVTVTDKGKESKMTVKKDIPVVYMVPQNANSSLPTLRLGEPLFWLLHNHKEMVVGTEGNDLKEAVRGSNQDIDRKNNKKLINTI